MKEQIKQIIKDSRIYELAEDYIDHTELAINTEEELNHIVNLIMIEMDLKVQKFIRDNI